MSKHYKGITGLRKKRILTAKQLLLFDSPQIMPEDLVDKPSSNTNEFIPVKALGHTPPYKIHKYFARRPWNVFCELIKIFSDNNDVILDPFCGGGVTIYEGLRLKRNVIGFDLNPLAIFVVNNMLQSGADTDVMIVVMHELSEYVESLYSEHYYFTHKMKKIRIDWIECTFRVKCPECSQETLLSNQNKIKPGLYQCSNQECITHTSKKGGFSSKNAERLGHEHLLLVGVDEAGKKIFQDITPDDISRLDQHITGLKKARKARSSNLDKTLIPDDWDRQKEDTLKEKGILYFQDLFTERNLLINELLLSEIISKKDRMADADYKLMRLAFSNTIKETNIMSFTNASWQGGRPTTWSKHAYWIPSQFCEVNIQTALESSFQRILNSIAYNREKNFHFTNVNSVEDLSGNSNLLLINSSITEHRLPDNCIDSIVTDPPYGSNVQYLELSHFWYVWNKDLYDAPPHFELEAVANRKKGFTGAKSMYTYEVNLFKVFEECYRVLKPDKYMTMTFNNRDISAWLALLFSIFKAGFTIRDKGIYFQTGVENYKQTAHTKYDGAPYGDFIYVFQKAERSELKQYGSENEFANELHKLYLSYSKIDGVSKYDWLMSFLNEAIPLIEGFAKSFLRNNTHNLYKTFNKSYLKKVY